MASKLWQPIFSDTFPTEWHKPVDFPTGISRFPHVMVRSPGLLYISSNLKCVSVSSALFCRRIYYFIISRPKIVWWQFCFEKIISTVWKLFTLNRLSHLSLLLSSIDFWHFPNRMAQTSDFPTGISSFSM